MSNGPYIAWLVVLAAWPACAQERGTSPPPSSPATPSATEPKKDPQSDPGLSDPSLEDEITGHRRAGPPPQAIPPTPPKPAQKAVPPIGAPEMEAPGISSADFSLPARRFFPEGSLLPARRGQVLRARTGELIFVPERGEENAEPAMVLLTCQRLSQLEAAAAAPGFSGRVSLGGQVFVYRDRHYLLPSLFSTQGAEPTTSKDEPPQVKPPKDLGKDPRAEDLMRELENQRPATRALEPGVRKTESSPKAEAKDARALLTEGAAVTTRRGRMVRVPGEGGRYAFAFDNDPNSSAHGSSSWRSWPRRAARTWCTRSAGA